jgi:hypothetical protein
VVRRHDHRLSVYGGIDLGWNTCDNGPSGSHHDLPELTALLEIAVRIRRLVEGEGTVYDGLERAGLQALGDKLDRGFAAGFITTREPDVVRLDFITLAIISSTGSGVIPAPSSVARRRR